jgi:uncharacterized protein (DUF1810 family)
VTDPYQLSRFVEAQDGAFETALAELEADSKHSHWMWFVFPQLAGLGRSPTAQYYALGSIAEARAYLNHPLLGSRLRRSVDALLPWSGKRTARQILGDVDSMKLHSSLTLFDAAEPGSVFRRALDLFFRGEPDQRTLALLNSAR